MIVKDSNLSPCIRNECVIQLVGASSHEKNVGGSIPGQGTYPGFRFDSRPQNVQEGANRYFSHINVAVFLSKSNKKNGLKQNAGRFSTRLEKLSLERQWKKIAGIWIGLWMN